MITPDWDQYQSIVTAVKKYPKGNRRAFAYLMAKLSEETGEVAKEVRRCYDKGKEIDREALKLELGDCLWVLVALSEQKGIPFSEVVEANLNKLKERNLLK